LAFNTIKKNIGSLPLTKEEQTDYSTGKEETKTGSEGPKVITKTVILPDGSYGTETIVLDDPAKSKLQQLN
jgi:hypothetical protein